MKKLFTLVVMLSLLSFGKMQADPHFCFTSNPVLNVGATSFNFRSVDLQAYEFGQSTTYNSWGGWVVFNESGTITYPLNDNGTNGVWREGWLGNQYQVWNIIDIGNGNFQDAVEGYTIRVNFDYAGDNMWGWFYQHRTTEPYSPLDGVKNVQTYYHNVDGNNVLAGYFEAVINADALNYLKTDGINIHAQDMTVTSVQIVSPSSYDASNFDWTAKPCGDISITGGYTGTSGDLYTLDPTNSTITFSGGGAIVITADGKADKGLSGYRAFYVVTIPYAGNHVWNFEDFDHEGAIHSELGYVTPNSEANWKEDYKSKSSQGVNSHEIMVANPNSGMKDGYSRIYGTNAYYIPETAGLYFDVNSQNLGFNGRGTTDANNQYVTWGGRNAHDNSGYNPTFTIPQVQGGKYIKVWWNGMDQGGLGANFQVENLLDLDDVEVVNQFQITGVNWTSGNPSHYKGGVIVFKVKGNNPSERKDVVFKLKDTGWNDLYRIEITDTYSTDMVLVDQTNGYKEVLYNNEQGHIVIPESELGVWHKTTQSEFVWNVGTEVYTWPIRSYMGDGNSLIERAQTCRFEVIQEPSGIVDVKERQWKSRGNVYYYNLDIERINGTGNIKITQKVLYGNDGYVLDKKETWIAIGTYKQQSYPYTWDFTDYNVSQGNLYAWLSGSNTYGTQKYGHWAMENSETYALETHEQVNGTILNGQTNQYEKVDKPLFAQGSQMTYWKQDETIGVIKEAEGLRVKQAYGTKGELAVGETFDGEITIDGKSLIYTPADQWSRLHITIPNVDAGMYVFIKADDATEDENYANPSVKIGNSTLTADANTYNTKKKVRAYQVTTAGDVDITFSSAAKIKAIGVTNIFKNINVLGYATESRDVDIDHVYEGEFTKNDVNAYCIQTYNDEGFTYEYKGTPMVKKSQVMNVIPKNTGIVLYKEGHSGDAFNVPLFYPACNAKVKDAEQITLDNNWMAPNVGSTLHESETEMRGNVECQKFVMSRQYYVYHRNSDGTGTNSEERTSEQEAFYRMRLNSGVQGTSNTMGANKAYLLIPTSKLPVALWNNGTGEGKPGYAKPGVIFMDDIMSLFGGEEPISGIATSIDAIDAAETANGNDTYYTVSGMQIQGKPAAKGIYIKNGKKVFIK